jgi:hypothetical protein
MELSELLHHLTSELDRLKIPYLITGSMATIAYGEPRLTNDIDVVVDLPLDQVEDFCRAFPAPEFYCSLAAVRNAVLRRFQFNILHPSSGLKIDVMIPEPSEFNRSRLSRAARLHTTADTMAWFASPEDAILKKLEYYRLGGSDKHLRDIAGVLKIRRDRLDFAYLALWAQKLGVADLWQQILSSVPDQAQSDNSGTP